MFPAHISHNSSIKKFLINVILYQLTKFYYHTLVTYQVIQSNNIFKTYNVMNFKIYIQSIPPAIVWTGKQRGKYKKFNTSLENEKVFS